MKNAVISLFGICLFVFAGCGGSGGNLEGFGIALMDGMQDNYSELTQAIQVNDASFHLGDLRATTDYFFLLYNNSEETITDITITSDQSTFQVMPSSMESLSPQAGAGVLPILRVSAVHGLDPSGIGIADLMTPGENQADITIAGTTPDGAASLTVSLAVGAKVMDIILENAGQEVDLTDDDGASSSTAGGLGFIRRYINITDPSITNTGNVTIEVTYYRDDEEVIGESTMEPDDTLDITMPTDDDRCLVVLDSRTVCDPDRFQLGNDGKAYFFLDSGSM